MMSLFSLVDFLRREKIIGAWTTSQFDEEVVRRYGIGGIEGQGRAALQRTFVAPLLTYQASCSG